MSNEIWHEMLSPLVQFMLHIFRVHYSLILINISEIFGPTSIHFCLFSLQATGLSYWIYIGDKYKEVSSFSKALNYNVVQFANINELSST